MLASEAGARHCGHERFVPIQRSRHLSWNTWPHRHADMTDSAPLPPPNCSVHITHIAFISLLVASFKCVRVVRKCILFFVVVLLCAAAAAAAAAVAFLSFKLLNLGAVLLRLSSVCVCVCVFHANAFSGRRRRLNCNEAARWDDCYGHLDKHAHASMCTRAHILKTDDDDDNANVTMLFCCDDETRASCWMLNRIK